MSNLILYVQSSPIHRPDSGLACRTLLVRKVLSDQKDKKIVIAVPESAVERERAMSLGWDYFASNTRRGGRPYIVNILSEVLTLRMAKFGHKPSLLRLLTLAGGGVSANCPRLARLINTFPGLVILNRGDLVSLLTESRHYNNVIVDTNDCVARLTRVYDPLRKIRLAAGMSNQCIQALVQMVEIQQLKKCGKVVAISTEDYESFKKYNFPNLTLEETCVVSQPKSDSANKIYDVGLIAGSHSGSHKTVLNLIQMIAKLGLRQIKVGIAGAVCSKINPLSLPSNVILLGRVDSSVHFWSCVKQTVMLSDGETGVSVKFQEAILSNVTVIANKNAARWSCAVAGRDYFLADNDDDVQRYLNERTELDTRQLCAMFDYGNVKSRLSNSVCSI